MKILYLIKSDPAGLLKPLIDKHSESNEVKVINLTKNDTSYETIVDEIEAADKVISW